MADVNPNQDLRFKEIMRRMVPSAYMMFYVFVTWKMSELPLGVFGQKIMSLTSNMGAWIRFSFLVVALYIMGYIINIIASLMERYIVYKCLCISRPSRQILNGNGSYIIAGSRKIINDSGVKIGTDRKVGQKQASEILRFVKGKITRRDNQVEDMYYQSIVGRNLLCAHIMGFVFVSCLLTGLSRCTLVKFLFVSILLAILFGYEWRRKNFVYVRNVFEEYLRKETKEICANSEKITSSSIVAKIVIGKDEDDGK